MPRPATLSAITANQARYILEKLIDEGTVTAADVRRHLGGMWQELGAIERRIEELRSLAGSVHPIRRAKQTVRKVQKRIKSAKVLASQRLQGEYIRAIQSVPKSQRARFAKIAKAEGRQAAITAIEKRGKKG